LRPPPAALLLLAVGATERWRAECAGGTPGADDTASLLVLPLRSEAMSDTGAPSPPPSLPGPVYAPTADRERCWRRPCGGKSSCERRAEGGNSDESDAVGVDGGDAEEASCNSDGDDVEPSTGRGAEKSTARESCTNVHRSPRLQKPCTK
jgi:hypothetical protein